MRLWVEMLQSPRGIWGTSNQSETGMCSTGCTKGHVETEAYRWSVEVVIYNV